MKIWYFIAVAAAAAVTYATINGNYEVTVQIVPPLVSAPCSFGQWWRLPNITCAVCFCMTGTLSRCLPQMGCLPSSNVTTTTPTSMGTSTTPVSMGTSSPEVGAAEVPPTPAPMAPSDPPSDSSSTNSTTAPGTDEMESGSGEGGRIKRRDMFS